MNVTPVEKRLNLVFLVNAKAGAAGPEGAVANAKVACESRGWRCHIAESPSDLSVLTRAGDPVDACVTFGGDGTISAALNALPERIPIAIVPLGTENLLARYLGATASTTDLLNRLEQGSLTRLDAMTDGNRLFTLMAGVGFDAEVVRRLHAGRKGHISRWSYAKPILETIRTYDYPSLTIRPDGVCDGPLETTATPTWKGAWAFVTNVALYAGGLRFSPKADPTDGLLDVCTLEHGGLWSGLGYLGAVAFGRHNRLASVRSCRAKQVTIDAPVPVPYQIDGDPGGETPATFAIVPSRLGLIVSGARETSAGWWEANRLD